MQPVSLHAPPQHAVPPQSLLNIALSYTAREEITHAVREVADRVASGHLAAEEVDEVTLERFLYTGQSEKPELLISPTLLRFI